MRAFLEANWDPELSLVAWRGRLADAGWACPTWPRAWCGRDLTAPLASVVAEELARVGAVGPPEGPGMILAAPTILEHGSEELKGRLIRPTVTGEVAWCQLFSEPGAGSDLAGLSTHARPRRRRVGRLRSEALDDVGPPRRLRHAPRQDRLGRPEAPRHHLLRPRAAPARRRGAAATADERPRLVQRGLHRRGACPRRQRRRRDRRRLGRGALHTRPRAPPRRLGAWRTAPRAGHRPGAARGGRGARRRLRPLRLVPAAGGSGRPRRRQGARRTAWPRTPFAAS